MKLSVVVITQDEQTDLKDCLKSVAWADEIVIVDSGSTDATLKIAQSFNAKIFTHPIDKGLNYNKSLGNQKSSGDWILSLDADERVSSGLAKEIQKILTQETQNVAYKIPRKNHFLGKWIRSNGWWPDAQIRLFKKGKAKWAKGVHEVMFSAGPIGTLKNPILHYSYKNLYDYFRKFNFFTSTVAGEEWEKNKRITKINFVWRFILNPIYVFLRKYFLMYGWREGGRGLFISFSSGLVVLVTALKIWEKQLGQHKSKK